MTVVSWTGGVFQFDGDGNLQNSYDPDPSILATAGKSRSMAFGFQDAPKVLIGDVNLDGEVNLLDVAPFVDLVSVGMFQLEADVNEDGSVNLLDVSPFVDLLSGG